MADDKEVLDGVSVEAEDEEPEIITLEFDDGESVECEIIGVFDYKDKDYIALAPENDTDDVYIYGYEEFDDDSFELKDIDDDDLFKEVAQEFDRIMDSDEDEEDE
ncbi:MAG: DUF1292 domain-containing protein [Eubacteriales bacterium]|nr:DUF1292 domain-containing protein [Eubacteriales bacterium]